MGNRSSRALIKMRFLCEKTSFEWRCIFQLCNEMAVSYFRKSRGARGQKKSYFSHILALACISARLLKYLYAQFCYPLILIIITLPFVFRILVEFTSAWIRTTWKLRPRSRGSWRNRCPSFPRTGWDAPRASPPPTYWPPGPWTSRTPPSSASFRLTSRKRY